MRLTGGYIEKQTIDREMDREITYNIYIYMCIMIFKAAINMGNDHEVTYYSKEL